MPRLSIHEHKKNIRGDIQFFPILEVIVSQNTKKKKKHELKYKKCRPESNKGNCGRSSEKVNQKPQK